ncbi:MAG: hypothetical protein KGJ77_05930 [Acidobacteriota bacterium]|nr:hypothetical protein [Acidobacteriota bacterium]
MSISSQLPPWRTEMHKVTTTYDGLLEGLLGSGMVSKSPGEEGTWVLAEPAQHRLDLLVARQDRLSAEELVYLDHRCAGCGDRRLTRFIDGAYLCDRCRAEGARAVEA